MQSTRAAILANVKMVSKKRMEKAVQETELAQKQSIVESSPQETNVNAYLKLPLENEADSGLNTMTISEFESGGAITFLNGSAVLVRFRSAFLDFVAVTSQVGCASNWEETMLMKNDITIILAQ